MTATRKTTPPVAGGSNRSMWIVGAVVLVVGIALVAAIAVSSSKKSSSGTQPTGSAGPVVADGSTETAPVTVTGSALPQRDPSATTDPAVGQVAPTLTGVDFAGHPITIANDGKPKVIMFLAHWCPHCQAEVPRIQTWLDQNGMPADVSLYSVPTSTTSSRPNYPPSDWLVGKNWTVPVLVDSDQTDAANAYGLTSFPYFVVVGADGKVVERTSGELTMPQFEALLASARSGTAS
jgi:cytochrome c biogenesis protein CcmG/thiol:disulfide interchange protein DsbE